MQVILTKGDINSMSKQVKERSPFAIRLCELMEDTNTTQEQLAKVISTSRQTISQYMNGDIEPKAKTFAAIAKHFKVTADYLLGLTDTPTSDPDIVNACKVTGLTQEEIKGLTTIRENEARKRNIKAKDRQDPFVNARAALNILLTQGGGELAPPGLVVLSYINLYLEASGTADINDPAFDIAKLHEEHIALAAVTSSLSLLKYPPSERSVKNE
jgi:transcriptional regulator with XRE-family HTH domain